MEVAGNDLAISTQGRGFGFDKINILQELNNINKNPKKFIYLNLKQHIEQILEVDGDQVV